LPFLSTLAMRELM